VCCVRDTLAQDATVSLRLNDENKMNAKTVSAYITGLEDRLFTVEEENMEFHAIIDSQQMTIAAQTAQISELQAQIRRMQERRHRPLNPAAAEFVPAGSGFKAAVAARLAASKKSLNPAAAEFVPRPSFKEAVAARLAAVSPSLPTPTLPTTETIPCHETMWEDYVLFIREKLMKLFDAVEATTSGTPERISKITDVMRFVRNHAIPLALQCPKLQSVIKNRCIVFSSDPVSPAELIELCREVLVLLPASVPAPAPAPTTPAPAPAPTTPIKKKSDTPPIAPPAPKKKSECTPTPITDKHCKHACDLTYTKDCCRCTDKRPISADGKYETYIDGIGRCRAVSREHGYCSPCKRGVSGRKRCIASRTRTQTGAIPRRSYTEVEDED
jgi:hypothetical protein